MEKTQIREYFTLHRIILLVIIAFLIYLFVYYNIRYKREKKTFLNLNIIIRFYQILTSNLLNVNIIFYSFLIKILVKYIVCQRKI